MNALSINTPVGTASYPHLTQPDSYMGKEAYKCNLVLDPSNPAVNEFIEKVNKYVAAAKQEATEGFKEELAGLDTNSTNPKTLKQIKTLNNAITDMDEEFRAPLAEEFDKDTDKPTGNWVIKTKSNASFKDKKTGKIIEIAPKIFDATGHQLTGERPDIRGGSKLALGIKLIPYNASFGCGISAQISAVQVVSLASGGSGGGDGGFAAVAGGYVAPKQEFDAQASDSPSMEY